MLCLIAALHLRVLTVGEGKDYARIEQAVEAARSGDEIDVYPGTYLRTAVWLTKRLRIIGKSATPISLDGSGYDYSGVGSVPRAIVQFDPGSDGSTLAGFDLAGAHNESHNGAGVRINQASNVSIVGCEIHGNDMGVMSNGREGDPHAGENQLIENSKIYANGSLKDPGFNHNFYLGGTSATISHCTITGSLTGHNIKSRAHFTLVEYCWIAGSANRECDFVEAWDTERPNSNAVLIGNVIRKDPKCTGNRTTIHFGKEKGRRNGTIYLINNTVETPFLAPVLDCSDGSARLTNNVIVNTEQRAPILVQAASPRDVMGSNNWISSAYDLRPYRLAGTMQGTGRPLGDLYPCVSSQSAPAKASYVDGEGRSRQAETQYRYVGPGWQTSAARFIGAG